MGPLLDQLQDAEGEHVNEDPSSTQKRPWVRCSALFLMSLVSAPDSISQYGIQDVLFIRKCSVKT
jgi:hypothetical protein